MARILVTDPVHQRLIELLKSCGHEVTYTPKISRDELLEIVGNYDALIVRSGTRVDREVLEVGARGRLRIVARAGSGLDNIDVGYAKKLGIEVLNAPSGATQSVAELTIGLMISATRMIHRLWSEVLEGRWRKEMGFELAGKTLLIIGFGRIGRRVAEIAKALGMRVLAYDVRDVSEEARAMGIELVNDLCRALSEADVVSLHVPLNDSTKGLIDGEKLFNCFKRGSILVNTSRGSVVDPRAVLEALERGVLSFYATDVLEEEPPRNEVELKLVKHPRALVTPHVGAQTLEAQLRIAEEIGKKLVERLGCSE